MEDRILHVLDFFKNLDLNVFSDYCIAMIKMRSMSPATLNHAKILVLDALLVARSFRDW